MKTARKWGNRPSTPARAAFKLSLVLAGLAFATSARAECGRETLQKLADNGQGNKRTDRHRSNRR